MKKIFLTLTAIIFALVFALSMTACDIFDNRVDGDNAQSCSEQDLPSQVVRIHIRANSNSAVDQGVKLLVRDKITEYLSDVLCGCASKNEALSVIQKHGSRLKQIADLTLKSNGFAYKSAVSVKKEQFPDKTYGEHFFPSGVYDALIIELGSGEGDNWWCVAFPPLCFVPDGDGETVAYKSWVKEQLDKIFD